jgi:hypothetical protein
MRVKAIHACERSQTQAALVLIKKTIRVTGISRVVFLSKNISHPDPHVSVRVVQKTIPIPYRYEFDKGLTDQSTGERVPVPVQACADREVGCIFHRKIKPPPIPAP